MASMGPLQWLLVGVVLMLAEALVPGVFLVWFGLGALATAGLVALAPGLDWHWQWAAFALASTLCLLGWRGWRLRHPQAQDHPTLNRRGAQYLGRRFTLHAPIVDGVGRMQVDDTVWKVAGEDAPAGTRVEVTGVDGAQLQVRRIDG